MKNETFGLDEDFVGFGSWDSELFHGEGLVGFPEHGTTHGVDAITS